MSDGGGTTRIDNRVLAVAFAMLLGGTGFSAYNAVSPAELAREDHDRLVRIEALVVTHDARMDAIEAAVQAQERRIGDHAERVVKVETMLDYLHMPDPPLPVTSGR